MDVFFEAPGMLLSENPLLGLLKWDVTLPSSQGFNLMGNLMPAISHKSHICLQRSPAKELLALAAAQGKEVSVDTVHPTVEKQWKNCENVHLDFR